MNHEREFGISYFHNLIVHGLNYYLFIMFMKQMVSMESKEKPVATSVAFLILSSQSSDQNFVFLHRTFAKSLEGFFI
jgi:hypothetical protein